MGTATVLWCVYPVSKWWVPAESPGFRINGLDLAWAVAIAGMVLVNFQVALSNAADSGGGFSLLVDGITGRAAATWLSPFLAAGRMALTIYVAHVVVLLVWEFKGNRG